MPSDANTFDILNPPLKLIGGVLILLVVIGCTSEGRQGTSTDERPATATTAPETPGTSTAEEHERTYVMQGVDSVRYETPSGPVVILESVGEFEEGLMDIELGGTLTLVGACLTVTDGPHVEGLVSLPHPTRLAPTGDAILVGDLEQIPLGWWIAGTGAFFRNTSTDCAVSDNIVGLQVITDWGAPNDLPPWEE